MDWAVLVELVKDAEMNLFLANGTGLGAILLAIVVIVFIFRLRKPDGIMKWALTEIVQRKKQISKK
jgi:hypothetical protein